MRGAKEEEKANQEKGTRGQKISGTEKESQFKATDSPRFLYAESKWPDDH
jgi:hypothetical protein